MAEQLNTEQFIEKARQKHGDKYNYDKVVYVRTCEKVIITCLKHGDFLMTPNTHLCGCGCKKCGYEIVAKYRASVKNEKSFASVNPDKIDEWSDKNERGPETYSWGSHDKVWRKCRDCGYEYLITINKWNANRGCPACSDPPKVVTPRTSLAGKYPVIASEWDYEKNKDTPDDVSFGSEKKRWFKCRQCNRSYLTSIYNRTGLNSGCSHCNSSKGERVIKYYLESNHINHEQEYKVSGCKNKKHLRFDFAILDENNELLGLIEYNGEQHYNYRKTGYFACKVNNLKTIQKRDKIKFNFCKDNNIPLLIIPYTEFKNTEKLVGDFLDDIKDAGK